jgi:hypothetical protein
MKPIERLALWLLLTLGLCGCASGKTVAQASSSATGTAQEQAQSVSDANAGSSAGVTVARGRRRLGVIVKLPPGTILPADGGVTLGFKLDDGPEDITAGAQGAADAGAAGAADAGMAGGAGGTGGGSANLPGSSGWKWALGVGGLVALAAGAWLIYRKVKAARALLPLP